MPSTRHIVLATIVAAVIGAGAQEARLRIASPTEATYLAGKVRFQAIVEPAAAAREVTQVTFFADGTQVCAVTTAPFECDWDSGERIKAHQIRVVALMRSGQRLGRRSRQRKLNTSRTSTSTSSRLRQLSRTTTDGSSPD